VQNFTYLSAGSTYMKRQPYALSGIVGPVIALFFIALSIALSPWFSWSSNALSDLGHSVKSDVAPLYNFGLLLAGLFLVIYSVTTFTSGAKYTSCCLFISALSLQLIATFDEVYGSFHTAVSSLFFVSLGFASIIYAVERRSILAAAAFAIGFGSWAFYYARVYITGIAVPEIVSSVATVSWIVLSALGTYLGKYSEN